jgi:hypothetical protein
VDPAFAAAAAFWTLSSVGSVLPCVEADGTECRGVGPLLLRDTHYRPGSYLNHTGLAQLLRGLASQAAPAADARLVPDLLQSWYEDSYVPPAAGYGVGDAAVGAIVRERDFGLPPLAATRARLGLPPHASFASLARGDARTASTLASLYQGNVSDVELWVGGLVEGPTARGWDDPPGGAYPPPSFLGATFTALVGDTLRRSRDGDRFYWRNPGLRGANGTGPYLPPDDAAVVARASLSAIVARVTSWDSPPPSLFSATPPAAMGTGGAPRVVPFEDDLAGLAHYALAPELTLYAWPPPPPPDPFYVPYEEPDGSVPEPPSREFRWVLALNLSGRVLGVTAGSGGAGGGARGVWAAVGLGASEVGADMWVFRYTPDPAVPGEWEGSVVDGRSTGRGMPVADAQQDVVLTRAWQDEGGRVLWMFSREADTRDADGDDAIVPGPTRLVFAWSTATSDVRYHGVAARGTALVARGHPSPLAALKGVRDAATAHPAQPEMSSYNVANTAPPTRTHNANLTLPTKTRHDKQLPPSERHRAGITGITGLEGGAAGTVEPRLLPGAA